MKRDMDLIREILRFAENNCKHAKKDADDLVGIRVIPVKLSERYRKAEPEELKEHVILAEERKLIVADCPWEGFARIYRLTWEGHDFLDNSRSPIVWKAAGHMSFTVFVAVLARLAADRGLELLKSQSPELLELLSAGLGGGV